MFKIQASTDDNGKRVDNVVTKNMVTMRPELEISRINQEYDRKGRNFTEWEYCETRAQGQDRRQHRDRP